MSLPASFSSARLHLRPIDLDDAASLHALFGEPAAMRWWSHPPLADVEDTRAKLEQMRGTPGWCNWAIVPAEGGAAIGTLSAHEKRQGRVFEIGYGLVPAHGGHGFAREAVSALLDQLFGPAGARRAFADTDPDNAASNRLLAALGFRQEGRLRAEWETHIGVRDSLIWGLLAGEWRG
ncbi:GNAT family N-acetyltransferase [Sphingomonas aracearum]|uniref:N-acetyltransferase n=1 Tax=Sphingomonas aracearum TaxID=2283317 RepID=A0A369VTR7_9SPHN|nr:GNAT family protein [Sphingomonas aracearum]RDE05768.1 N-acetyltransferase [Sphingomonas aracearum]